MSAHERIFRIPLGNVSSFLLTPFCEGIPVFRSQFYSNTRKKARNERNAVFSKVLPFANPPAALSPFLDECTTARSSQTGWLLITMVSGGWLRYIVETEKWLGFFRGGKSEISLFDAEHFRFISLRSYEGRCASPLPPARAAARIRQVGSRFRACSGEIDNRSFRRYAYMTIHYEGTERDDEYVLGIRVWVQSLLVHSTSEFL